MSSLRVAERVSLIQEADVKQEHPADRDSGGRSVAAYYADNVPHGMFPKDHKQNCATHAPYRTIFGSSIILAIGLHR